MANTIEKFLETMDGKSLDDFDAKKAIVIIKEIADKIPKNGEYDTAIIGNRIGQYIYAIQECGKVLASLGLIQAFQETEVEKSFSVAMLEKATQKGYKTAGEKKVYAQMDEDYIRAKNKLNELEAIIAYIENYRISLDKAHLHCKKIIDRGETEKRFGNEYERFPYREEKWVDEKELKTK